MGFLGGITAFWANFGKNVSTGRQPFSGSNSLATAVLDYYGIPYIGNSGGPIRGVDIKHMDALQVIKISLLENDANGGSITEIVNGPEGDLIFVKVGQNNSELGDVYYSFQTTSYMERCVAVQVTGYDPVPIRKELEWKNIFNVVYSKIYDMGITHSTCANGVFNQYCTIIYNDPQLDTAYEDGIENFYEISSQNPWDSVVGYARFLYYDGCENDTEAQVKRSDTAKIVVKIIGGVEDADGNIIVNIGSLKKRPTQVIDISSNPACFEGGGVEVKYSDGVPIPIPEEFRYVSTRGITEDKFNGVVGVYAIGKVTDLVRGVPSSDSDAIKRPTAGDELQPKTVAVVNRLYDEVISLELGRHWLLGVDNSEEFSKYSIVFIDNSRIVDPVKFEDGSGGPIDIEIDNDSDYTNGGGGTTNQTIKGVILPTGPTTGILVKEIYVALELNTPSIEIYHPNGKENKARQIAETLEYGMAAIIVTDEPPPIAINGSIIDQRESIRDHDPTTTEVFRDTSLEARYSQLEGGGISLTLSCLNKSQCASLSSTIKNHLDRNSVKETTYVCGPLESPTLGNTGPDGGIINGINYSYQDGNAYTISVNTGGALTGNNMTQIQGGPHIKATESYTSKGTIIQDAGNSGYFKVRVDGFGDVFAVSMVPEILRVGDKVSVSIHNNPVEA